MKYQIHKNERDSDDLIEFRLRKTDNSMFLCVSCNNSEFYDLLEFKTGGKMYRIRIDNYIPHFDTTDDGVISTSGERMK